MLDTGTQKIVDTIAQIQRKEAGAREQNRRDFPQAAALVDMWNAEGFGPVRLIWAQEGGREIGKRP